MQLHAAPAPRRAPGSRGERGLAAVPAPARRPAPRRAAPGLLEPRGPASLSRLVLQVSVGALRIAFWVAFLSKVFGQALYAVDELAQFVGNA